LHELLQDLLEHLGRIILPALRATALAVALSGGIVVTMVVMVAMALLAALIEDIT
jgi:hypothetical protein